MIATVSRTRGKSTGQKIFARTVLSVTDQTDKTDYGDNLHAVNTREQEPTSSMFTWFLA